jgi:hypothetical protein
MNEVQIERDSKGSYGKPQWDAQERHYKEMLKEAQSLWIKQQDDFSLLRECISWMHNLSSLYEEQGESTKAYYYLVTPHNWVVDKLHDPALSKDDSDRTLNILGMTFTPLYEYSHKQECCNTCRQNLEEQREWFEQTMKQLH